jgi:hypothetical protein
MPLRRNTPTAVLPQARLETPAAVADEGIQRMATMMPEQSDKRPSAEGHVSLSAPPNIQRNSTKERVQEKAADRKAVQAHSASSRASSGVRRAPLPLAKLRTQPSQPTVQRTDDELLKEQFLGVAAAGGARGTTQSENLGGGAMRQSPDAPGSDDSGSEDDAENNEHDNSNAKQSPPNLDHLARAIVPIVKRMLTIERERRISR